MRTLNYPYHEPDATGSNCGEYKVKVGLLGVVALAHRKAMEHTFKGVRGKTGPPLCILNLHFKSFN